MVSLVGVADVLLSVRFQYLVLMRVGCSCPVHTQDRGRGRTRYGDKGAATGKDKDAEATMGGRYPR